MTNSIPTSRGVFGYGCDVLAGVSSAFILGLAVAHAGSVTFLFAYVATLPLFMAGLSAGFRSGLLATACGTACLFALAPSDVAVFYLLADALPALAVLALATRRRAAADGSVRWISQGTLLSALVIYPCILFLIAYAVASGTEGGLLKMTIDAFDTLRDQVMDMLSQNGQKVTPEIALAFKQSLDMVAPVTPALVMCAWTLSTMIALILSQSILCRRGWNLRPNFELALLRLPVWMLPAALVCVGASLAPGFAGHYAALNLALALGLPFFLTGLAVVHAAAARTRWPTAVLVAFYIVTTLIPYFAPVIALIGAIDQAVDLRARLAARAASINHETNETKER